MTQPTLADLAADLAAGRTTALQLTLSCLAAIEAEPQGAAAYVQLDKEGALLQARWIDEARANGKAPSRFAGIPVAIKDLFDIAGQVTRAGSVVLEGPVAKQDAAAVAALRAAGFVLIGRSNMTEFAFSGLGMNPHFGTPLSPWHRDEQRLAGGSTSGGAVAVAHGMAHAALGSDTGGSCRIPAAWCNLVGFKPTAARVSRAGTVPLSTTLDSIGSIGRSVRCCATMDAILSGAEHGLPAIDLSGLRFGVVTNIVRDDIEPGVAQAFDAALRQLRALGCELVETHFEPFDRVAAINAKGGFPAAEGFAWHRRLLDEHEARYDPRVAVRVRRGAGQSAADYIDLLDARANLVADAARGLHGFDGLLMPTTPILPPQLADMADDAEYGRINLLALRNPTLINMIDGCAISLPIGQGGVPAGLMMASGPHDDRRLLAIAAAVEQGLRGTAAATSASR
jgi:aspartyl-tRNA(Asn)/glutamyl-tRNA(Gln) amidotransferase subunit A